MPAVTLRVRRIVRRNGKIYVDWSDKSQTEYASLAHMRESIRPMLERDNVRELLRALIVARALRDDVSNAIVDAMNGMQATMDLDLPATMVVVS